ncbi:hypothetical protein BJ996_000147 [Streptomyces phaeogriseichromatogenes]|nr:hypothetical protein [Streptomyces murinus]
MINPARRQPEQEVLRPCLSWSSRDLPDEPGGSPPRRRRSAARQRPSEAEGFAGGTGLVGEVTSADPGFGKKRPNPWTVPGTCTSSVVTPAAGRACDAVTAPAAPEAISATVTWVVGSAGRPGPACVGRKAGCPWPDCRPPWGRPGPGEQVRARPDPGAQDGKGGDVPLVAATGHREAREHRRVRQGPRRSRSERGRRGRAGRSGTSRRSTGPTARLSRSGRRERTSPASGDP